MKAKIRKQLAKSIQNRPSNLRYHKENSLDDLVAMANIVNRKKRKKSKKESSFVTDFKLPSSSSKSGRKTTSITAPTSNNSKTRASSSSITVERSAAADTMFETLEIPSLAAVAALGLSSSYGLGYWERRFVFLVCAVIAAVGRRWTKQQEEKRKEELSTIKATRTTFKTSLTEEKLALPLAWCFVAYWCLGGKWWLRSLVACVAFCVRFAIENSKLRKLNLRAANFR
jgi:hypothetical protein